MMTHILNIVIDVNKLTLVHVVDRTYSSYPPDSLDVFRRTNSDLMLAATFYYLHAMMYHSTDIPIPLYSAWSQWIAFILA